MYARCSLLRTPGRSSICSFPVIIVGMTQLLAFPLGMMRQPRVISEVIAGIILGPTGLFLLSVAKPLLTAFLAQ
jgi:Kef-type K+ transport system membrane component KefB